MKTWRWIVVSGAALSFGILIISSLLIERYLPLIRLPSNFKFEPPNLNPAFLERPGVLAASFGTLFTLCLIGILFLYIIPERIRFIADSIPNKTGLFLRLMLMGFLVEVLITAAGIGSALMIGTFPLTILLLGILFLTAFTGFISVAYAFGRNLIRRAAWQRGSPVISLILGVLILYAIARIPFLGGIFLVCITSLGLGATILSHFGSGQSWNLNSLQEDVTNG